MRGCITKKGKGYAIVIYLGRNEQGKKKQKWYSGYRTKKEAESALTTILNKYQQNIYIEPTKMTVKEYLTEWIKNYVEPNLSPATISGYKVNVEKHIIPEIGNIQIQKLQPIHIQNLYTEKINNGRIDGKGGLKAKSVIYIHRVLRKALQQAVKLQIIERNVADYVELPKIKKYYPNMLNEFQVKDMIILLKETSFYIPVLLSALTGMRRGEVLGLKWSDIDFSQQTINIQRTLIPTKNGIIFSTPKTKKSNRTILITETLVNELLNHKEKQENIKTELEEIYQENDLVNCSIEGLPLNPSTFSSKFSEKLKKLELPHIRFHDLRHINATLMLKNNISAKIASERLGHSSIGITLDLYSHVISDMQKEAADKLDNAIFNKGLEKD